MSVVAYIVVALALGIGNMVLFRNSALSFPVRLSRGLGVTLVFAAVQAVVLYIGILVGDMLRFEMAGVGEDALSVRNSAVALGLLVFVALKMLAPYWKEGRRHPAFDLGGGAAVMAMALAASVNALFVGLAFGFARGYGHHMAWGVATVGVVSFLFSLVGVMYGRCEVALRPRVWLVVSAVMLLGVAVAIMVDA